jgi:transposase
MGSFDDAAPKGVVDMETLAEQALRLKQQVKRLEGQGSERRFPSELRAALMGHAEARRAEGASLRAIGAELGVSDRTLWYWLRKGCEKRPKAASKLLPVRVVEVSSRQRTAVLLHGPGGVWVEGLDVPALAELLRRLS